MSTLADQLKALGFKARATPATEPSVTVRKERVAAARPQPFDALLELPHLGEIVSLNDDQGFGHLSCAGDTEHVFFHFTNRVPTGRIEKGSLSVGDPLVFITGTNPRKPDRTRAVRWACVLDVPSLAEESSLDQEQLDELRRASLDRQPLQALWHQLHATWYDRDWGKSAPANLVDPVLGDVWRGRLSSLSVNELIDDRVRHQIGKCRYGFAAALDLDHPGCSFAQLLEVFSPLQLAVLGAPDSSWMDAANTDLKPRLLEWHLVSQSVGRSRGNWAKWLQGREDFEPAVAEWFVEQELPGSELTYSWLRQMAQNGHLASQSVDRFSGDRTADAVALFDQLSELRQRHWFASWKRNSSELGALLRDDPSRAPKLLACGALAIDLETDGEKVWEVGCASGGKATLLHAKRDGTDLATAMAELSERIAGAPLVIGHNLIAWDWPILIGQLNLDHPPLIWDTLLVQYLLEPQAPSHALGGAHRADADALATLTLFSQQLQRLPAELAGRLLRGEFRDVRELLDGIVTSLGDGVALAHSLPAAWPNADGETAPVVLMPEHRLRELDWVPEIVVLQADPAERLPDSLWQIDGERLEQELAASGFDSPAAQVLLAVMRMAQAQDIALRRNMIPLWLSESAPGLATAIDRAGGVPAAGAALRVSPLPASAAWWAQADPAGYRVAWEGDGALIVGRSRMAMADVVRLAGGSRPAGLVCVKEEMGSLWLQADRVASMLDPRGGWSAFMAIPVPAAQILTLPPGERPATPLPVLATRRERVLHPGAEDQATYWQEVLRTFREVGRMTQDAVPILLVGSSTSRELVDLLATGLAEIEVAELRPQHRSRREHLLRAARLGLTLVDRFDQWPAWLALAESVGISLMPVAEALPLEEWYAAAHPAGPTAETKADTGTAAASPAAGRVSVAVSGAALLAALPGLTTRFLGGWLHASGLADASLPVWIIDPRAGSAAFALRACMEPRAADGAVWSPSERSRLDVVLAPLRLERKPAPADYASMERFLVERWQPPAGQGRSAVSGFKESQKSAMEAICARASDVLVPLPTGEGKSVLFQVPALCRGLRNRRLTLVISPLKALMKDQVERLREQGFAESADFLSGDLTPYELEEVLQGVMDHRIVLLYVAPERLRSPAFMDVLGKRIESDGGLEHVVVDEVHCVNQWGYEFRPDYFHAMEHLLHRLRDDNEGEPSPFLLLSATVTASDRARLMALLNAHPSRQLTNQLLVRPDAFTNPLRAHIEVSPQRVHGRINDKKGFAQAVEERLPVMVDAIAAARRNKQATGQRSAVIVFVAWRMQAEELAALLAPHVEGGIDYYHAGLDGTTRNEIYLRFREGELDVLVATKAFGMGMDIPDIHWVVHLGPPTYLEDYLQEVGRIGRGVAERQRAGLKSLQASLLFSNADFESNRDLRAQGALQFPMIEQICQQIDERAEDLAGARIAFVPQHGYAPYKSEGQKRANATRLRMSLYWLERAGAVVLHGVATDLLAAELVLPRLRQIAEEQSPPGAVARTILLLESQADTTAPARDSGQEVAGGRDGWLSRLLGSLNDTLGSLFDAPAQSAPVDSGDSSNRADDRSGAEQRAAVINLSQIRVRCAIKTMDEVMACLADLEKRGAVAMRWTLSFTGRPMAAEYPRRISALFASVGGSVDNLIDRLSQRVCLEFDPHELLDEAWNINDGDGLSAEERQRRRRRYERAWLHGFRSQARSSGLRLRQLVRKDEKLVWEAKLARTKCDAARHRNAHLLKSAQALFKLFRRSLNAGQDAVSVPELIRAMQAEDAKGRFQRKDLKPLLNLLAAMGLVSARPDTLPASYVVELRDVVAPLESQTTLRDELKQVNALAEVRVQAMEIFANLSAEARERFIEGYFAQTDAEGLKAFLDAQLGEIEDLGDEDLSGFIRVKREQLRATRVVEFFKFYEASEEPNQWKVIQHPFDRHLLVNAGPGAGKTAVLVGRIAHLIREQQIKPAEIVVLAFNRAVVFEIRKRVRELFTSLGYGSYVRSIRVSTFHSLAMRSLAAAGDDIGRDRAKNILADFAGKLSSDTRFRAQVAGGCRCILVDEFQDVTEDVYAIVHNLYLGSGSRAGVMVIGDDDQDILRWQRKKSGAKNEFAGHYFKQFRSDFEDSMYLELGVNFRSAKDIVERSQKTIVACLERNRQSSRLKEAELHSKYQADARKGVERLDWRKKSWNDALDHTVGICRKLRETSPGSLAVLCRSNAEVSEAHHRLAREIPNLVVQGGANLRVADLRHVALWIDFLEQAIAKRDSVLTNTLKNELSQSFLSETDVPETRSSATQLVKPEDLWGLCCEEHPFPHLSTLVRFIRGLQTDELDRLLGSRVGESHAVVSTIHKVKGLEFDNVVVLPSKEPFGTHDSDPASVERDAAEEVRLLYVAMTRAKTRLVYFAGDREYAWGKSPPGAFDGARGTGLILGGSMEDVGLGWAMERNGFNRDPEDTQRYIEKEVRVGDPIVLGGSGMGAYRVLMHCNRSGRPRQVGFLAEKRGAGTNQANLEVSAVIRFRTDMDPLKVPPAICERGWGYVVLVSGRLR